MQCLAEICWQSNRLPTTINIAMNPSKIIGIDPGKREIVCMTTKSAPRSEGQSLRYIAAQRRFESRSDLRSERLEKMKNKKTHELKLFILTISPSQLLLQIVLSSFHHFLQFFD